MQLSPLQQPVLCILATGFPELQILSLQLSEATRPSLGSAFQGRSLATLSRMAGEWGGGGTCRAHLACLPHSRITVPSCLLSCVWKPLLHLFHPRLWLFKAGGRSSVFVLEKLFGGCS